MGLVPICPIVIPIHHISGCVGHTREDICLSPSRGRIMVHCQNLASPQQGNQSITEYMQDVIHNIDSLTLMNVPVDFYELPTYVLNGLGPAYSNLSHALQVRETPVTFEELFEQLLSYKAPNESVGSFGTVCPPFSHCLHYFGWSFLTSSVNHSW